MTRRTVLAPGLRVLERGRDQIQIGLEPEHRILLRANPAVRRTLAYLDRGEAPPPSGPHPNAALSRVLVDADALAPDGVAPGDAAAAALADPVGFPARLAARRTRSVSVIRTPGTVLGDPVPDPAGLLAAAGVGVTESTWPAAPGCTGRRPFDAALVLSTGEPDREITDQLASAGIPHLLVRAVAGAVVLGPLVEPGRTACLRCLDSHRAAEDPLYPLLAATHHRAVRRDGVAEPVDTALVALAVAWAARDVITHLDGDRASTWSATVRLANDLSDLSPVRWRRHPACSCVWTTAVQ